MIICFDCAWCGLLSLSLLPSLVVAGVAGVAGVPGVAGAVCECRFSYCRHLLFFLQDCMMFIKDFFDYLSASADQGMQPSALVLCVVFLVYGLLFMLAVHACCSCLL